MNLVNSGKLTTAMRFLTTASNELFTEKTQKVRKELNIQKLYPFVQQNTLQKSQNSQTSKSFQRQCFFVYILILTYLETA